MAGKKGNIHVSCAVSQQPSWQLPRHIVKSGPWRQDAEDMTCGHVQVASGATTGQDQALSSPKLMSPTGSSKESSARSISAKSRPRVSSEAHAGDKIKPVASVRAAEAEERRPPGKAKQLPLPVRLS